jgi:heme exporter protein A
VDALLEFQNVRCRRGGRLLFEAMTLRVERGGRLLLRGPNGSGKSSLLRLAAWLLRPEAGTIDRAPAALADEAHALDPELPLIDALRFWARLDGSEARLGEALAALDLDGLAQVPVRLLSAGQLRRAGLARVAAAGALLWLLDEPANALDSAGLQHLQSMMVRHCAAGGAVVAASHQPLGPDWPVLELGR